jgi:hypothetical protein
MSEEATPILAHDALEFWCRQLALSPQEAAAVRRTGTIARERRGRNRQVFQLAFRLEGARRTKYLAASETAIAPLRDSLSCLRAQRRRLRSLKELARQARRAVKVSRGQLRGALEREGYYLHGERIRRCRADH